MFLFSVKHDASQFIKCISVDKKYFQLFLIILIKILYKFCWGYLFKILGLLKYNWYIKNPPLLGVILNFD